MNKNIKEFFHRGLIACGFGPLVLAIVYYILYCQGILETLSVPQVCSGIFTLSVLAFIAGGINVIYQIEQMPLMVAILIHGVVLYIGYLVTYLVNSWLEWGITPIFVFSGIFVFGYLIIWAIIYFITKNNTLKLNKMLHEKQQTVSVNTDL